jgi:ankyrin repeat protein
LIKEGGLSIEATDNYGLTPLMRAAFYGRLTTVQWLLEHGGADITVSSNRHSAVWAEVSEIIVEDEGDSDDDGEGDAGFDAAAVTALLKVMVLRGAHYDELIHKLSPEHTRVVQEGARLQAGLLAYLARR